MNPSKKTTEQSSDYDILEKMPIDVLLRNINKEDQTVALRVRRQIPAIEKLTRAVLTRMKKGGRLFYLGAGTSGRLGIVDASECPPTYGIPHGRVVGLIAGGDKAIRKAVEFAEDDPDGGWKDLRRRKVTGKDFVIGIAASGTTPYVVGALEQCRKHGIKTGCITCNRGTPLAKAADYAVEVVVGPEFVTGSTRMKIWHRAEAGAEHDFHVRHDTPGQGQGQPHGGHATHEQQTRFTWHGHAHERIVRNRGRGAETAEKIRRRTQGAPGGEKTPALIFKRKIKLRNFYVPKSKHYFHTFV